MRNHRVAPSPSPPWALLGASLAALAACADPAEPARVELSVVADGAAVAPVDTDLGYRVDVTEARLVARDLVFTTRGEQHVEQTALGRVWGWIVPSAHAHPGHAQGGEVLGELPGRHVLAWVPARGEPIGTATLLAGTYDALDFTFERAVEADGLSADDPLLGHTAILRGSASRDGVSTAFVALLDAPVDRALVGVPFSLTVDEGTEGSLGIRLSTLDPLEGDTLFDGIDFAALDPDATGSVLLAEPSESEATLEAYYQLRRTFQTHDHFDVAWIP